MTSSLGPVPREGVPKLSCVQSMSSDVYWENIPRYPKLSKFSVTGATILPAQKAQLPSSVLARGS